MKRKIFGLLLAMMALVLMGCPNPATDASGTDAPATDTSAADQAITLLAIPGVTAPVISATPVATAIDTEQYTGTIAWSGTPASFAGNTVYTATIVLTAKAGWTLTGVAANSFTVAGATETNGENSGTIAAVFPATSPAALSIGDAYQGGIIAYIFQPGDPGYVTDTLHGLIASSADLSSGIIWAIPLYQDNSITTGTAIGTGQSNTATIILQNGPGNNYAAGLCDEYINVDIGTGQYTDWYLPSRYELNKVFLNRAAVGGFNTNSYWTSSQSDSYTAWYQQFVAGGIFPAGQQGAITKATSLGVRAVRTF